MTRRDGEYLIVDQWRSVVEQDRDQLSRVDELTANTASTGAEGSIASVAA